MAAALSRPRSACSMLGIVPSGLFNALGIGARAAPEPQYGVVDIGGV